MQKMQPKYCVGDVVSIKSLEDLKKDLGDPIDAQCGWSPEMNRYAGGSFRILECRKFGAGKRLHYSYLLDSCHYWWFSEDTFEAEDAIPSDIQIGYDEFMQI